MGAFIIALYYLSKELLIFSSLKAFCMRKSIDPSCSRYFVTPLSFSKRFSEIEWTMLRPRSLQQPMLSSSVFKIIAQFKLLTITFRFIFATADQLKDLCSYVRKYSIIVTGIYCVNILKIYTTITSAILFSNTKFTWFF